MALSLIKKQINSLLLLELFRGLSLTGRVFLMRAITIRYPEEQAPISPRFRGMLALRRYANGEERCIACRLCEVNCPAAAITIDAEVREDGSRRTTVYDIDAFKCIYCGFCEEACPVDAVVLTSEMHYHMKQRGENILTKEKLLALGDLYEKRIADNLEEDSEYR